MSRIGKLPISIPSGVSVAISNNVVTVKGPKGELSQYVDPSIKVNINDGSVVMEIDENSPVNVKQKQAFHGLYRSLVNNMVIGVSQGYKKELELVGVGYRVSNQGNIIEFSLGYTVPGVIDISSTELREQLASGTGENLLPPAVYGYILRNHLYGTDVNLKSLTLSQLRPVALSYLKYKRIPHVLGTEQEAIRLATRYGADVEKARVAALLHDCTKKLDMPEQLALCRQYGIELDELEQKALKLLHAKTGAAIAREVFGVDDEIYRAIWWHTTGHADMTLLEKIIYLADYIEPSRDFPGVNDLRACVYENLDRGMLMGLEMTIDEMTEMGNPVHHATMEARDWLKGKR